MFLLLVLVFTYHVIHSARYEAFLRKYQALEDDEETDDAKTPQDPLTRLIIRYSLVLTIFALFIECVLLPINALNLGLVVFMTVLSIEYLRSESLLQLYERLGQVMNVLKWTSVVLIFLKYMF